MDSEAIVQYFQARNGLLSGGRRWEYVRPRFGMTLDFVFTITLFSRLFSLVHESKGDLPWEGWLLLGADKKPLAKAWFQGGFSSDWQGFILCASPGQLMHGCLADLIPVLEMEAGKRAGAKT